MIASMLNSRLSRLVPALLGCMTLWPACSGDRGSPPYVPKATGGSSSARGGAATATGGRAGGGRSSGAGRGGVGGVGAAGEDAGDAGGQAGGQAGDGTHQGGDDSGTGGTVPTPPSVCSRTATWSAGEPVDVDSMEPSRFASITPDERVIAWTSMDAATVTLYTAHRNSAEEPFGPASSQTLASAEDRVALGADGLRVVFVNPDRRGFSVLRREALDQAFDIPDTLEFSLLNGDDAQLQAEESYGDPVLSADDRAFVYSRFGAGVEQPVFVALRFSQYAPWAPGWALEIPATLQAEGALRVRPTAIAADRLTLFVWQPSSVSALLLTRDPDSEGFNGVTPLGPLFGSMVNADCSRLYYGSSDSPGIAVAERIEAP